MKPWVTRRDLSRALAHLRRADALVRWARARGDGLAPLPEGVLLEGRGWGSAHTPEIDAWEAWRAAHRDRIPGDLLPPEGEDGSHSIVLAAVSLPPVERLTKPQETHLRDLLTQCLVMLASEGKPGDVRTLPAGARGRARRALDSRQGRDDASLYALAWWTAVDMKAAGRLGDGHLRFLWRTVGHAMTERLTIDEVWAARKRLVAAL